MKVTVLLFAMFRQRAGARSVDLELADGATAADALAAIGSDAGLGELIERMPVRVAVNREYVARHHGPRPRETSWP